MKTNLLTLAVVATAVALLTRCSPSRPSPGAPPGLSYFTYADTNKNNLLKYGALVAQRVDPTDTTRILVTMILSRTQTFDWYSSDSRKFMFTLKATDGLFVRGPNKLRIFNRGGLADDWLEVTNQAEEWVAPTLVKFNGKAIPRLEIDQPANPSYLYVLQ